MSALLTVDFWSYVAIYAGIYVFLGFGLQVQLGYTGIVNFGVVGSMAVSAYTFVILIVVAHLPLAAAMLGALIAAGLFALLLGPIIVRLREDYLAIATVAIAEIVRYVALNATALTGGSLGTIGVGGTQTIQSYTTGWNLLLRPLVTALQPVVGSAARNVVLLLIVWAIVALIFLILRYWLRSPWGRVLKAIRDDDRAALALGKRVTGYRIQALVLGSIIIGIGGIFYALTFSSFAPADFTAEVTTFTYMIIIMGGLGILRSVPVGALIFAAVYAGTRFFDFPPFSLLEDADRAFFRMILIGVILIAIVWLRPQGIFGRRDALVLK